jgi:hypothetical protein
MRWARSAYDGEQRWEPTATKLETREERAARFYKEHPDAIPVENAPSSLRFAQVARDCLAALGALLVLAVLAAALLFLAYIPVHFIVKYW